MNKHRLVKGFGFVFSLCLLLPGNLYAKERVLHLQKSKNDVSFLAIGRPSALKIRGKYSKDNPIEGAFKVEKNKLSGSASLLLTPFKTGIKLRDEHMHEKYLETNKFPKATIVLSPLSLPIKKDTQNEIDQSTIPFEGTLSLRGKTQKISGNVEVDGSTDELELEFEFELNLNAFDIKIPKYLGITVAETVKVEVSIEGKTSAL